MLSYIMQLVFHHYICELNWPSSNKYIYAVNMKDILMVTPYEKVDHMTMSGLKANFQDLKNLKDGGTKLWRELLSDIKDVDNVSIFKNVLKAMDLNEFTQDANIYP